MSEEAGGGRRTPLDMDVIDVHTHAFPDAVAAAAIAALEEEAGVVARYDGTVGGLLGAMDRTGIAVSVIQPVATRPGQVERINDWAASIASERIVPFGAMHPDLKDPSGEVARMSSLGIRGFKMHPEYQDFRPDEERLLPILEAAMEHDMVVLFHCGLDIAVPTLNGDPAAFARMLDRTPGLEAILAHMGGFGLWDDVRRHLVGRDVWLDTSYTLGHLPEDEFVGILRAHGADRVLFGSDGPWTDAGEERALLEASGLTADELRCVLVENAGRLLSGRAGEGQ